MRNLNEMTDEELALAYVEGNNKAFDLLLAHNEVKLFSYIMFVVHDEEVANDIFQETFVKAIVKLQMVPTHLMVSLVHGSCALRTTSSLMDTVTRSISASLTRRTTTTCRV